MVQSTLMNLGRVYLVLCRFSPPSPGHYGVLVVPAVPECVRECLVRGGGTVFLRREEKGTTEKKRERTRGLESKSESKWV